MPFKVYNNLASIHHSYRATYMPQYLPNNLQVHNMEGGGKSNVRTRLANQRLKTDGQCESLMDACNSKTRISINSTDARLRMSTRDLLP